MTVWRRIFASWIGGTFLGVCIAVPPMELAAPLTLGVLILALIRLVRDRERRAVRLAVGIPSAVVVVAVCAALPYKWMDEEVGPVQYDNVAVADLCNGLYAEHGLRCRLRVMDPHGQMISVHTDEPMSRREVLEKLAAETGTEINVGYCGNGASVLYGAYPIFVNLTPHSDRSVHDASSTDASRPHEFPEPDRTGREIETQ